MSRAGTADSGTSPFLELALRRTSPSHIRIKGMVYQIETSEVQRSTYPATMDEHSIVYQLTQSLWQTVNLGSDGSWRFSEIMSTPPRLQVQPWYGIHQSIHSAGLMPMTSQQVRSISIPLQSALRFRIRGPSANGCEGPYSFRKQSWNQSLSQVIENMSSGAHPT